MRHSATLLALLSLSLGSWAQDTYSNYSMTSTADVIGSARYVGMGGAMGALGADISAISNNPASLGLFRRNDASFTLGVGVQDDTPAEGAPRTRMSFDQLGLVFASSATEDTRFVWGVNLQKKANFGHSFTAGSSSLHGFSQAAQLAAIYGMYPGMSEGALPARAFAALLYDLPDGVGVTSSAYDFYRNTRGYLYGLDINLTIAHQDRVYVGATMGLDFMRYRSTMRYMETRDGTDGSVQDYDLESNHRVSGEGLNIKLGAIFRPIEDSPFRFGITVETPTWYTFTQERSYHSFASKWDYLGYDEQAQVYVYDYLPDGQYAIYDSPDGNELDFNVFSPWKLRAQIGSTIGRSFAWDVEYEYAFTDYTKMGYPTDYDSDGPSINMDKDVAMSRLTHATMQGVHNVRAGFEYKPVPEFAVRAGYNYWSKPMKSSARLDQSIDSYAMEYTVSTDYMNLGATNMLTIGMGYRHNGFYADVAYKYRAQHADFYPFDDQFQAYGVSEAQFGVTADALEPQRLNLDRHNVVLTLGYKF